MADVFVGRQPLFDRKLKTVAYELLFRSGDRSRSADFTDGTAATAQVISNGLTVIGFDDLVGDKIACINVSDHFLTDSQLVDFLPADRVMLEILEDVQPTQATIDGVHRLRDLGFKIALDDFVPGGPTEPLRDLVHVVKYDLGSLDDRSLQREIERDHAAGRCVVVERIETADDHAAVASAGADYFQGYFFAQPSVVPGARVPQNTLALVRLATAINRPEVTTAEIVDLLTQDVSMSVQILRVINSAAHGLTRRVDSIQQAAVMIGRAKLRGWVAMMLLASIDDKPVELVAMALTRAKFCELVAERRRLGAPVTFFAVGMLSMLESLTDRAMPSILEQIAVNEDIRTALLGGRGPLADALDLAILLERSVTLPDGSPIAHDLLEAHQEATAWTTRITSTVMHAA